MKPFFDNVEKILRLENVAESWRGTRFMPNAAIKHAGVSCQKLMGATLKECGHLPMDFEIPDGPMDWSHAHKDSLIEKFMDEQTDYFAAFKFDGKMPSPGDMLGFKLHGCIHHCGLLLNTNGKMFHCMRPQGVMFNNLLDASYWSRLVKFWRPIENVR